jgi:hypothetical protein
VGIPCDAAKFKPSALARLLITAATAQGKFARNRACILLPRPEIKMTIFFIVVKK